MLCGGTASSLQFPVVCGSFCVRPAKLSGCDKGLCGPQSLKCFNWSCAKTERWALTVSPRLRLWTAQRTQGVPALRSQGSVQLRLKSTALRQQFSKEISASSSWLGMQHSGPPDLPAQELLGGDSKPHFNKPSKGGWCKLKFENHSFHSPLLTTL